MEEKSDLNHRHDESNSPPDAEKHEIVADGPSSDYDDSHSPEEMAQLVGWILFDA